MMRDSATIFVNMILAVLVREARSYIIVPSC